MEAGDPELADQRQLNHQFEWVFLYSLNQLQTGIYSPDKPFKSGLYYELNHAPG